MRQNSSFPRMASLVDRTMRVEGVLRRRKYRIKLRLLNIGFVAVYCFQRGVGINGEAVRSISHNGTVFFMAAIEFQMSVAFPGMVDGVPVCDFGAEWAWIFG